MLRRLLLASVLVLVGCVTPAPSASPTRPAGRPISTPSSSVAPTASPRPEPTATSRPVDGVYLALGDSLGVGVGARDPGNGGYVARLFRSLRDTSDATVLRNLSVSGETSGSLLSGGQLDRGRNVIDDAGVAVSVVTLDIGGNDLLHLLNGQPCASAPDGLSCRQLVAATLQTFDANYRSVLSRLTDALARSSPRASLAVMTYFNPFSGTDAAYERAAELALLGSDLRIDCPTARRDQAARGMNDIIACGARSAGAVIVDVHPLFAGLGLRLTHIGARDIHANDRGYRVIAAAFAGALAASRR